MILRRVLVESSVVCQRVALFVLAVLVSKDASTTTTPRIPSVSRAPSQNTADKFSIFDPAIRCDDDSRKQYWCQHRFANNDRTHGSCKCVCRGNFLTYLPELQTCVSNEDVYSVLGDCSKRPQDQTGYPPLSVVSERQDATRLRFAVVPWPTRYVVYSSTEICSINHENSFYRVHGQWKPITKGVFLLRRDSQLMSTKTVLQWSDTVPSLYSGRIIRLDLVNCSELWYNNVRRPGGCLLLKVAGTIFESIKSPKVAAISESPTKVPSNGTDHISRSWTHTIRPSNVLRTVSNKASVVPFAVQRGVVSSVYSTAYQSTATNTQSRVPDPSLMPHVREGHIELSSFSPPPALRHGEGTRDHHNLTAVIGGATTGGLVLLIVVIVFVKFCRRKRRSEYSVNEGAPTEANRCGTEEDLHYCGTVGSTETFRTTSMPLYDVLEAHQSIADNVGEKPSELSYERRAYGADRNGQTAPLSGYVQRNLAYETTDIVNRLQGLEPSGAPEYDELEDPTPCTEASRSVSRDELVLGVPEYHVLEGPTAEEPDYDVLEGPDPVSVPQIYGSLVGRTTETYATLRRH